MSLILSAIYLVRIWSFLVILFFQASSFIGLTFIKSIHTLIAPPSVKKLSPIIMTSFVANLRVLSELSNHRISGFG